MKDILGNDLHPAWAWVAVLALAALAGSCTYYVGGAALAIWGGGQ